MRLGITYIHQEQKKDSKLKVIITYLEEGVLPQDEKEARKIAALATSFDKVLYFVDKKKDRRRCAAVPNHLRSSVLQEYHGGRMSGHFSGS